MHTIDIANAQSLLDVDGEFLREVARQALRAEEAAAAEISIALVDDQTIHELNNRHLAHDYPTDVLSFLFESSDEESAPRPPALDPRPSTLDPRLSTLDSRPSTIPALDPPPRGRGKTIDGEIVVSVETALRRAAESGWNPHDEVVLYVVHGLLHLAGYDDADEDDRRLMRSRERSILEAWNLSHGVGP